MVDGLPIQTLRRKPEVGPPYELGPVVTTPVSKPVPGSAQWRKQRPVYSGVLKYFPDAIMEVAYVSFIGNEQHNPGQPLHWSKEKSSDHEDCIARHLIDHSKNPEDSDGGLHLAKEAWRSLAALQIYLDKKKKEGQ
jgi:hypothetical protein